jgi:hypothetical protein
MKLLIISILILNFSDEVGLKAEAINSQSLINWQKFNKQSFVAAKHQNKFILLDLVAVWCHWCHVMEKTTYQDPQVVKLINQYYIPTKADHDLRPDLAERYRDWGWPATIILAADGTEIVKRAGYIEPENMARLLQTIIDDPSPESTTLSLPVNLSTTPLLSIQLIKQLQQKHIKTYDNKLGSLNTMQKFIDIDSLQWDFALYKKGEKAAKSRIYQTLDAAAQLIDPEFGGVYQYSTHGDWQHPHYEKIMYAQYKYLLAYSQACQEFSETRFCDKARKVADYLLEFLFSQDKGVFYTSQDADLKQGSKAHDYFKLNKKERLKKGLPRVDKHIYSAHNGQAIIGLLALYKATKDEKYLIVSQRTAQWIIENRAIIGGGFKHYKRDTAGPYLADTLYMSQALLRLYEITQQKSYLQRANEGAQFMATHFNNPQGGLVSAQDNGTPTQPLPRINHNIDAARFFVELYHKQSSEKLKKNAAHVMKLLVTKEIVDATYTEAGILLADVEFKEIYN